MSVPAHHPRLVFFGNERIATAVTTTTPVLRGLVTAGYDVAAVVTSPHAATSRRRSEVEIAAAAHEFGIPIINPAQPTTSLRDQLAAIGAPVAVLVAYGRIVPTSILELFPRGILNLHPSLLPAHRGPIPIEQTILDGDTETGVSIMRLTAELDAGPLYAQSRLALTGHESKQTLADTLLESGRDLLLDILPKILNDDATPEPQAPAAAQPDQRLAKAAGQIDWTKPADQLEHEVRAYLGWPGSRTRIAGVDVTVTAAHATPTDGPSGDTYRTPTGELAVYCGGGGLIIDRLTPAGSHNMSGPEFLTGHRL